MTNTQQPNRPIFADERAAAEARAAFDLQYGWDDNDEAIDRREAQREAMIDALDLDADHQLDRAEDAYSRRLGL